MRGKKFNNTFKKQVLGCYLTCLNYHEVARIMGISVNGVKAIVQREKKENPNNYAQVSTIVKKNSDKELNEIIAKTMKKYEDLLEGLEVKAGGFFTSLNMLSKMLSLVNRQDKLFYSRSKELYDAKALALTYECKRIEKAILLRDVKDLLKILEESKHDNKLYEPLDMDFLVLKARKNVSDLYDITKIDKEEIGKYNKKIRDYLIARGYKFKTGANRKKYIYDEDKEVFIWKK